MKDSGSSIFWYVLRGFGITTVLVIFTIGIEHTYWGHRVERLAFEFLQDQLSPFNPDEQLPIVVVDISEIREGKNASIVDFDKLTKVVSAIAAEEPQAIGIDAELTPKTINLENEDTASIERLSRQVEEYADFLDFCLSLKEKTGVPVFISVNEKTANEPAEWLGDKKYQDLAATILIKTIDTTRIPVWFKAKPDSEKLFSLSALLANSYKQIQQPTGISWAIEADDGFPGTKSFLEGDAEYFCAPVNYSKLEAIQQNKLPIKEAGTVKALGEKFRNRMIILGDDTRAEDRFVIAGRDESIPGVYLHASAAYTFTKEPMYEFKFWVRLFLDFFLSALIIVYVAVIRHKNLHKRDTRKRDSVDWHTLQFRLGVISFIGIAFLAYILVCFVGVLWLDFLMVAFFLLIHPKLRFFYEFIQSLRKLLHLSSGR